MFSSVFVLLLAFEMSFSLSALNVLLLQYFESYCIFFSIFSSIGKRFVSDDDDEEDEDGEDDNNNDDNNDDDKDGDNDDDDEEDDDDDDDNDDD